MNKKIAASLFATGLIFSTAVSAGAYTKSGSCNSIACRAEMTLSGGNKFSAGTYADKTMQTISVSLDGDGEWWADNDNNTNATSAEMTTEIDSGHAYSKHHADNGRGDAFDRSIDYINGSYK